MKATGQLKNKTSKVKAASYGKRASGSTLPAKSAQGTITGLTYAGAANGHAKKLRVSTGSVHGTGRIGGAKRTN